MSLTLLHDRNGDTVTIALVGDLELSTCDMAQQEVVAQGSEDGVSAVVVDLARVSFMDSAGINALLNVRRWGDTQGRSVRVAGAAGLVREVLELTGVLAHLTGSNP